MSRVHHFSRNEVTSFYLNFRWLLFIMVHVIFLWLSILNYIVKYRWWLSRRKILKFWWVWSCCAERRSWIMELLDRSYTGVTVVNPNSRSFLAWICASISGMSGRHSFFIFCYKKELEGCQICLINSPLQRFPPWYRTTKWRRREYRAWMREPRTNQVVDPTMDMCSCRHTWEERSRRVSRGRLRNKWQELWRPMSFSTKNAVCNPACLVG